MQGEGHWGDSTLLGGWKLSGERLWRPPSFDAVPLLLVQHTVGNRPDRYELRVLKRRPKKYKRM